MKLFAESPVIACNPTQINIVPSEKDIFLANGAVNVNRQMQVTTGNSLKNKKEEISIKIIIKIKGLSNL